MHRADERGAQPPKARHARWKLLLLLLVCVSPVVASYFTYYVVRPEGRRNFGELVQPQRPMLDLATATLDGLGEGPHAQLWPHLHGTDGMFLALLRKKA